MLEEGEDFTRIGSYPKGGDAFEQERIAANRRQLKQSLDPSPAEEI